MLFAQDGGGNKNGHLSTRIHGLECGAHRDFGLAIADVAADESIHGSLLLHVTFQVSDSMQLIDRFGVRKRSVKFLDPMAVGGALQTGFHLAIGLKFDHVSGHVADGLGNTLFLVRPTRPAQLGEFGRGLSATDVFLHEMDQ